MIDYNAMAQQFGGVSIPAGQKPDYDAIAKQFGEVGSQAGQPTQNQNQPKQSGNLLSNLGNGIADTFGNVPKILGQGITTTAEAHGLTENKVSSIGDQQTALIKQARQSPVGSPEHTRLMQQAQSLSGKQGDLANSVQEVQNFETPTQALGTTGKAVLNTALLGSGGIAGEVGGKLGTLARAGEMGAMGAGIQGASNLEEGNSPGQDVIGTGIFSALIPPVAEGATNLVSKATEKLPAALVNKYIKPLAKDFRFGKNPGQGIVDEKIVAKDIEDLGSKVNSAVTNRGQEISNLYAKSNKTIPDASGILAPIDNALNQAQKFPRENASLINRLNNLKKDLLGFQEVKDQAGNIIGEKATKNLKNISPQDLFNFKKDIGDIQTWTGRQSEDNTANKALKQVYGKAKELLNQTVPEGAAMNEHFANLKSAQNAIRNREVLLKKADFFGLAPTIAAGAPALWSLFHGDYKTAAEEMAAGLGYQALSSAAGRTALARVLDTMSPGEKAQALRKVPIIKRIVGGQ